MPQQQTQITVILPDKPRTITPAEFYGSGRKYKVLLGSCTELRRPHRLGAKDQHRDVTPRGEKLRRGHAEAH
jgi:hypothetical protein